MTNLENRKSTIENPGSFAVRHGCGLIERDDRALILVTGGDAYSWLQGMVSNDVRQLQERANRIRACILNATGHILADLAIVKHPAGLLLDFDLLCRERILALLEGFIITEDVELVDRNDTLVCLSLQGPIAPDVGSHVAVEMFEAAAPADHTGAGGLDFYVERSQSSALRKRLMELGAASVGQETIEVLRIEAGIPKYGADMDEETIPLEAGLEATHISYTKGCYVGQEIIARIQSRGHTNRSLTGFFAQGSGEPRPGDTILLPEEDAMAKPVGRLTSVAVSPDLGQTIGLGMLRHEYRTIGTRVRSESGAELTVTALPFFRAV